MTNNNHAHLSPADINAMNACCEAVEAQFNGLIDRLRELPGICQINVELAQEHGEDAFMRAVRAVAEVAHLSSEDGYDLGFAGNDPATPNGFTR